MKVIFILVHMPKNTIKCAEKMSDAKIRYSTMKDDLISNNCKQYLYYTINIFWPFSFKKKKNVHHENCFIKWILWFKAATILQLTGRKSDLAATLTVRIGDCKQTRKKEAMLTIFEKKYILTSIWERYSNFKEIYQIFLKLKYVWADNRS